MKRQMTEIQTCDAKDCLYNNNGNCSTFAITVGRDEPCCDTFMKGSKKGGIASIHGGVGACHVAKCTYNDNFECSADKVRIGLQGEHADCLTYMAR